MLLLYGISDLYFWVTMYDFLRSHLESRNVKIYQGIFVWVFMLFVLVGANNFISIPIVNTVTFFCSICFIEICLYKGNLKRKVLLAGFVCIIGPISEFIALGIFSAFNNIGFVDLLSNAKLVIFTSVFSKILYGVLIKIINKVTTKRRIETAINYWISLSVITFGSIYLINVIFYFNLKLVDFTDKTIIALSLILLINMLVFYLYDHMLEQTENNMNNALYKQQAEYYERQYEEGREAELKIRRLRHDMKNHLICIKEYAKKEDYNELIQYISNISNDSHNSYCKANSGNLVIDSILNYKASEAEKYDITFEILLEIPNNINIVYNDLCTILGNSLDNAIEASKLEQKENRKINLSMGYHHKSLCITISNFYTGKLQRDSNNKILTTKRNKEYHGIGLKSIQSTVEKYNGFFEITEKDKNFQLEILIFNC